MFYIIVHNYSFIHSFFIMPKKQHIKYYTVSKKRHWCSIL